MLRLPLLLLALGLLWLLSQRLSPARGLLLGLVGLLGFTFNGYRAWAQGLSVMALLNFNFSDTSMLLVNLLSVGCCLLSLMVAIRVCRAGRY